MLVNDRVPTFLIYLHFLETASVSNSNSVSPSLEMELSVFSSACSFISNPFWSIKKVDLILIYSYWEG